MAASIGFKEGMRRASPVLLEPIMAVEVETPADFVGNVIGDLMSRRGHLQGQEDVAGTIVIKAEVPLAEMFGYATAIRSLSKGRSSYSMEPSHFEQVPAQLVAAVLDQKETK